MGNYNKLNTEEKESSDIISMPFNLEIVNKSITTHLKTLIEYIITDLNSTELKNKILNYVPTIITDHFATFLISELKLDCKSLRAQSAIDQNIWKIVETVLTSIS